MKCLVFLNLLITLSPWHGVNCSENIENSHKPINRTRRQSEFAWQDLIFGSPRNAIEGELINVMRLKGPCASVT
jgi:hypothetical protein